MRFILGHHCPLTLVPRGREGRGLTSEDASKQGTDTTYHSVSPGLGALCVLSLLILFGIGVGVGIAWWRLTRWRHLDANYGDFDAERRDDHVVGHEAEWLAHLGCHVCVCVRV